MKNYYVYLLSSKTKVLYVGVTNNLEKRMYEHKKKIFPGFTKRYNVDRLVHFEETTDVLSAINREKELKGWLRKKKIDLIEIDNPEWNDLSKDWFE